MIQFKQDTKQQLIELYQRRGIGLEGNIIKLIDPGTDSEFENYLVACGEKDKDNRRKRLEITKQIQSQNRELVESQKKNETLMIELQEALDSAEQSKCDAEKARDAAM